MVNQQNLQFTPKSVTLECFLIQNESYRNGNAPNMRVFGYFQTELTVFLYSTAHRLPASTAENAFRNGLI